MGLSIKSSAGRILNWWLTELSDIWDLARARPARRRGRHVVIAPIGDEVRLLAEDNGRSRELGAFASVGPEFEAALREALARHPKWHVGLRLYSGDCLVRRVAIPWQARRHLASLLRLDLESASPLKLDRIYHAPVPIATGDRNGHEVNVRQLVVKRERVDRFRHILDRHGGKLSWIDAWDDPSMPPLKVDFLAQDSAEDSEAQEESRARFAVAGLCAVLLVSAYGIFTVRQDSALEAVRSEAAVLQQEVSNLRREAAAESELAKRVTIIELDRKQALSTLEVLEKLSQAFPQDSWISQVDIDRSGVDLTGYSGSAAALLTKLAVLPDFTSAEFTAPVVFENGEKKERFSMHIGFADDAPAVVREDGDRP